MLAQSTPFTVMVEGVEQTYAFRLGITLPGGIYPDATLAVSELDIQQSITSDLPEGTRLVEGYPSAQATFTLAGWVDKTDETKTAEWLFNPYSTTSPLYRSDAFRSPVTIDLGLVPDGAGGTPELVRKFSGYVDSYTVTEEGTVQFTCIDKRTDLRSVTQLPPVVNAPPYNSGLTSEFAVDALLRMATNQQVSSWPPQRAQCLLAVGMRASLWAEVGSFLGVQTTPGFKPGAFGTAYADSGLANVTYRLSAPVGASWFFECWVTGLTASDGVSVRVGDPSAGTVDVSIYGNRVTLQGGSTVAITADSGAHYFAGLVSVPVGSTTVTATVWVDNTQQSLSYTGAARSATPFQTAFIAVIGAATVEAIQVTGETSSPPLNNGFVPTAVLDPSLNTLQTMPAVGDGDPWQTIQQIAQAELAVAGYLADPDTFRFYNRDRLRGGAVARTITAASSLQQFGINVSAASVVNRARVGYTNWTYAGTASTVYSAEAAIRVPKNGSQTVTVTLDNLATTIDTTVDKLPNGSTNTSLSFYRASSDYAGNNEFTGPLSFAVYQPAPDKLTITITNTTNTDAWLVSPANYTDITVGTPLLRIAGVVVTPNNEQVADWQYPPVGSGGAVGTRFGEVVQEITGNPWIQDGASALQMATDIVCESAHPIPDFTDVQIIPDPRLQLADRVRIQDPFETGVDEYARIFAITTSLTASDDGTAEYGMSIDARAITFPGGWILGVDGRSELGSTTWI